MSDPHLALATVQRCGKPLKPNPFQTYRDPQTGQWKVIPIPQPLPPGEPHR